MVNNRYIRRNRGFSLLEMMMVIVIVVILASIAYPSYQRYFVKTKRTQMMIDLQKISQTIAEQKVIQGNYKNININDLLPSNQFPKNEENKLYIVSVSDLTTGKWTLIATPIDTSMMKNDGKLTLEYTNRKCRILEDSQKCGMDQAWKY